MSKQTNIPKLRFPEFRYEWQKKKLGEAAEISSGGTPSRTNSKYWNGNIPWVSTTLIDFNFIDKTEEYITEEGLKNSSAKLFPKGTLLMAMYGQGKTRGKISILNIEASTNQACGAIITNAEILNSLFAFQNLAKRYDEIRDLSNQGGQENLSGGIIKGIEIAFPTLHEQTKIANFFTAIDTKLQALKTKKEKMQVYKKGVMQKIFSQSLRFKNKNGKAFADWEVKKLGDTLEIVVDNRGKTPPVEKKGIPLLEVNSIGSKEINYKAVSKFVNSDTFENWFRKYLKAGDVLFSTVGNTALCSYYDGKVEAVIAQNIVGFRFKNKIGLFMYYLLTEENNYNKMKAIEMGAVQPSIKVTQLTELFFNVPTKLEQTTIANFLSAIDEKINKTNNQITQMEQWKKGLLQKMFV
jgi:type I restriction enzyme, S subunit